MDFRPDISETYGLIISKISADRKPELQKKCSRRKKRITCRLLTHPTAGFLHVNRIFSYKLSLLPRHADILNGGGPKVR